MLPANRLVPQPKSENGDGRRFQANDGAELVVYGGNNATGETTEAAAADIGARLASPPDGRITYKVAHSDWFVISGRTMKQIFYVKGYLDHDQFKTFELTYPIAKSGVYNDIAAKLEGCFKSTAK